MRKKNKKVSVAQKPLLVLSRRAIAGWVLVFFLVCGWMFAVGVLVGRGTAPIKFDISALQRKLEIAAAAGKQKEQGRRLEAADAIKDKTDLDFYEALKDNRDDAKISQPLPAPVTKNKVDSPPEDTPHLPKKESLKRKTFSPKKAEVQIEPPAGEPVATAAPPISDPKGGAKPADKPYTIQVAAFKDSKDADKLVAELKQKGFPAYRAIGKVPGQGIWYRVRVGDYTSKTEAGDMLSKLKKAGMAPMLVNK